MFSQDRLLSHRNGRPFFNNFKGIENPAFVDFIKNIESEETLVQVHDIESPSSETGKSR